MAPLSVQTFTVLSVHYRYPGLLADQHARLSRCAGPLQALGIDLRFCPVFHQATAPEVLNIGKGLSGTSGFEVDCIELDWNPPNSAFAHGRGLADAYRTRSSNGTPEDLVAVLDHDAHPLHASLLTDVAIRLRDEPNLAGIGIPQWHRGHCYLHPSFLATHRRWIDAMGVDTAFTFMPPPSGDTKGFRDVGEGFTTWCEGQGHPILPMRVNHTEFPWSEWDSAMAPGGVPTLVGEHGEHVHVGNVMHYGLAAERSLVSHVWAQPLQRNTALARLKRQILRQGSSFARADKPLVLRRYLSEPFSEARE